MSPDDSFAVLMARLRARDDDAAHLVWHRFVRRLIGLARSHLDTVVRQKVDPEEVVQSVFRSFFLRHIEGQFDLIGWDGLWGLLALITRRKCGHQVRHFYGAVHNVRKEVAAGARQDESDPGWEAIDREPTAEEAASLAETLEGLMRGLSERERRILELRLQGSTVPEISQELDLTEFTVEGRLKKIRKRLHEMLPLEVTAEDPG